MSREIETQLEQLFAQLPEPDPAVTERALAKAVDALAVQPLRPRRPLRAFALLLAAALALLAVAAGALAAAGALHVSLGQPTHHTRQTTTPAAAAELQVPPGAHGIAIVVGGRLWLTTSNGLRLQGLPVSAATLSPRALYVAAGIGNSLVAMAPSGRRAWSHPTAGSVTAIAWAPDGIQHRLRRPARPPLPAASDRRQRPQRPPHRQSRPPGQALLARRLARPRLRQRRRQADRLRPRTPLPPSHRLGEGRRREPARLRPHRDDARDRHPARLPRRRRRSTGKRLRLLPRADRRHRLARRPPRGRRQPRLSLERSSLHPAVRGQTRRGRRDGIARPARPARRFRRQGQPAHPRRRRPRFAAYPRQYAGYARHARAAPAPDDGTDAAAEEPRQQPRRPLAARARGCGAGGLNKRADLEHRFGDGANEVADRRA